MNDEQQMIKLHDKAAREACAWRTLQRELEEKRDEIVPAAPHPDRLDAITGFESVMSRLCAEEAAAWGRMMRLREQIGRRPPRRRTRTR